MGKARITTAAVAAAALAVGGVAVYQSMGPKSASLPPGECFAWSPPPLFDTSDNPIAAPSNPRVLGAQEMAWNGHNYLAYNFGNDLAIQNIDDPANPGAKARSSFSVPPFGDRDYNLFEFSVCDDCAYGVAGFEAQGTVVFDLTGRTAPGFRRFHYYNDKPNQGGFVFKDSAGTQYLITGDLTGDCFNTSSVYSMRGVDPDDLSFVQCLETSTGHGFDVVAGEVVIASDGSWKLYLKDSRLRLHIYRFRVSYPPQLQRVEPSTQLGGDFDIDHNRALMATASGGQDVSLWSIIDPEDPALLSRTDPSSAWTFSNVAVSGNLMWTAPRGSSRSWAYDVSNPADPRRVCEVFWDSGQPWNSYDWLANRGATFTADGEWLFLSRFSVLERFMVGDGCLENPPEIFADGFESGDTSAWSR